MVIKLTVNMTSTVWLSDGYTIYGKTFEVENFHSYKKNLPLEKFHGLAVSTTFSKYNE